MDSSSRKSSSNKITDIVRLQQILKKWKKLATTSSINNNRNNTTTGSTRSINKFLKKTLSFSEKEMTSSSSSSINNVPRGYIVVCVGKELKRFVIPMEYLGHQVFGVLFGFQQQGPLKFPCQVDLFEKIVKMMVMEHRPPLSLSSQLHDQHDDQLIGFHVGDNTTIPPPSSSNQHPQMCR